MMNSTASPATTHSSDSGPEDTEPIDCVEYPALHTWTTDVAPISTSDQPDAPPSLPVKKQKSVSVGKQEREAFVKKLPTRAQLTINHQKMLARVSKHARTLIDLFDELQPRRLSPTSRNYHGDLASVVSVVRFIGGIHGGAHRDHEGILKNLEGIVQDSIIRDLRRIWISGVPNKCNAYSSQDNFKAFLNYGNHASVSIDPAKTQAAFVKDNKRSFNLIMDFRLVHFLLNAHLTPQGMVNISKPNKKDHPVFDSTFRPTSSSMAINDWTNKRNEPPLVLPNASWGS
jgi:hypothetical protein